MRYVLIGTTIAGLGIACLTSASAQTMSVETEWHGPEYRSGVYVIPAPAPVYQAPAYEVRPAPRVYQRRTYEYNLGYGPRPPAPIPGGTIATRLDPVYPTDAVPEYRPRQDPASYCMSQYQTYDPVSGTYLGYDGLRYPCP